MKSIQILKSFQYKVPSLFTFDKCTQNGSDFCVHFTKVNKLPYDGSTFRRTKHFKIGLLESNIQNRSPSAIL